MNTTLIDKNLLAEERTRAIIEDTFDHLSREQAASLAKYADDPKVEQYVWYSSVCALELKHNNTFSRGSAFMKYVLNLWEVYVDLPEEVKDSFSEHWDAVERIVTHVKINNAVAKYVDDVVSRYVETRDPDVGFIQGTLELFDQVDMYYHPEERGIMTEDERLFILEKTYEAFSRLRREYYAGKSNLRDQIAFEVFNMVCEWGSDEFFDRFENYPIGPDMEVEDIINDVSRVTGGNLFNNEEMNAYKHLKMRDIAELIRVNVNFIQIDEAEKFYDYFGQLVRELGDDLKPQYFNRYCEAGTIIKDAIEEQKNNRKHAKRRKN